MKLKIAVTGKNKEDVASLKKNLQMRGYTIETKNPTVVISFGGDGSFLFAEQKYPGVPKIITRNKSICNKCAEEPLENLLSHLEKNQLNIKEYNKLKATIIKKNTKNKKIELIATSDVIIRNTEQFHAIRFNLFFDNNQVNSELIGDGLVIATPFGSTGYFYSITKKSFTKGIGVALNNTMTKEKAYKVNNKKITFELKRNKAGISTDNNTKVIPLNPGDKVIIEELKNKTKIIELKK